jgi:hypothetical protein
MSFNRQRTILHYGRETTLAQVSRDTGVSPGCLQRRYQKGLRDADLVMPSIHSTRVYSGLQAPMNLSPRDDSHARRIALWVSRVAPWAGEAG